VIFDQNIGISVFVGPDRQERKMWVVDFFKKSEINCDFFMMV